jgi:hypothetical protein
MIAFVLCISDEVIKRLFRQTEIVPCVVINSV